MEQRRKSTLTLPELAMVSTTRVLLGGGLGLLLGERLNRDQRRAVGWALLGVGMISTIPLGFEVLGGRRVTRSEPSQPAEPFSRAS